jgi:hypothetical protein
MYASDSDDNDDIDAMEEAEPTARVERLRQIC